MEQLDVEGGFSIHEYRSGLKLLEQGRSTTTVENRAEYPCPVCGNPFDRLLVAEDGEHGARVVLGERGLGERVQLVQPLVDVCVTAVRQSIRQEATYPVGRRCHRRLVERRFR